MKRIYWFIFGMAVLLLLLSSFTDFRISVGLYNPDSHFGEFFAIAGMVPLWTFAAISAGLMFGALITQFESLNIVWRIITTGLLVFGVYSTYRRTSGSYRSRHLNGLPPDMLVFIVITAFMLATVLGVYASRKKPKAVFIAAIVGIVAVTGGRLAVNLLKEIWGRQRFWTMDDPVSQFTAWYRPQFPAPERLKEMGDKIASFPSGHSFGGISVLWLSMFPSFLDIGKKNEPAWTNVLAVFAMFFWMCTALSRIILGEHFLSDVLASAIIFLIIFVVSNAVLEKIHPAFTKSKK